MLRSRAALILFALPLVLAAAPAPPGGETCRGESATIVGTAGPDRLVGTAGDDVIVGLGGNDEIRGLAGDDVLCGGDGEDGLHGGIGADLLDAGNGFDLVDGDGDDDTTYGGAGNDSIDGGTGDDTSYGEDDFDHFEDVAGTDSADGGASTGDYCSTAIETRTTCEGTFVEEDDPTPLADDSLAYLDEPIPPAPATSSAGVRTVAAGAGGGPLCDGLAATILGTPGSDVIVGTAGADVIVAMAGKDQVHGLGGNDVICGRRGGDRLFGDDGNDRLFGEADGSPSGDAPRPDMLGGGAGDDVLDGGPTLASADVVLYGEAPGPITANLRDGTVTGDGTDTLIKVEGVVGSRYDDWIVGADRNRAEFVDLVLDGRGGNDTLIGGRAAEVLLGGDGDDTLGGNRGPDLLSGGAGEDNVDGGPEADVIGGGEDDDLINGRGGNDFISDSLGDNRIFAGGGDDQILGGDGDDVVFAGSQIAGDVCYQRIEEQRGCDFSRTAL